MIIQIFISMIFFQHYTKLVHYDTHGFNFLVHYIKDGGYYHYNIYGKDYYLKNTGYLIVINDFGLVKSINQKPVEKRDYGTRMSEIKNNFPNAYEPWKDEDDIKLKNLYGENKTVNEIAQVLARQPGAIRSRLNKLGLV